MREHAQKDQHGAGGGSRETGVLKFGSKDEVQSSWLETQRTQGIPALEARLRGAQREGNIRQAARLRKELERVRAEVAHLEGQSGR